MASEVRACSSTTMPIVAFQSAGARQFVIGNHANADDHHLGRIDRSINAGHARDPRPVAGNFTHGGIAGNTHPVIGVQLEIEFRQGDRHHARHQPLACLQHGHLLAQSAQRGGAFEADETAADDHCTLDPGQISLDRPNIRDSDRDTKTPSRRSPATLSNRGRAPVTIASPAKAMRDPSSTATSRVPRSMAMTRRPSSMWIPRSV